MINLIPFKQVGPFCFHKDILSYKDCEFEFVPCDDKTGWDVYKLRHEGIELYTENNTIVSIACRKEIYFKGANLIGLAYDKLTNEFNLTPTGEADKIYIPSDDDYQDVVEFDEIGIQVWIKEDKIETVFCSPQLD